MAIDNDNAIPTYGEVKDLLESGSSGFNYSANIRSYRNILTWGSYQSRFFYINPDWNQSINYYRFHKATPSSNITQYRAVSSTGTSNNGRYIICEGFIEFPSTGTTNWYLASSPTTPIGLSCSLDVETNVLYFMHLEIHASSSGVVSNRITIYLTDPDGVITTSY